MKHLRTDLAMEAFDGASDNTFPGVRVSHWDATDVRLTEVVISDPQSADLLGKPCGTYLTLECPHLRGHDPDAQLAMSVLLGEELARMLPPEADAPILVIGLGNRCITPDSLGPRTIDHTLVTRHMHSSGFSRPDLRSVCAVAPGVLGVTGVETMEMARCLVQQTAPRAVLCIDSLAAQASHRIGTAIQLTDTGIQPGGGVGNHRSPLTRDTLGVDVVAVGMPTVVYAATLARDAFGVLASRDGNPPDDSALESMERSLLREDIGEMIVTPREIDTIVSDAARIISSGVNRALHPTLSPSEMPT